MTKKHKALSRRYLTSAKKLMEQGDYLQASEKLWGAAAQAVKAYADQRGLRHNGHAVLFSVLDKAAADANDPEIVGLFDSANVLHMNFHENWLTKEQVKRRAKDVEKFVKKIEKLLK